MCVTCMTSDYGLKLFSLLAGNLVAGAPHLKDIFYRMGLSDKHIVALSGGHTLVLVFSTFHYLWASFGLVGHAFTVLLFLLVLL